MATFKDNTFTGGVVQIDNHTFHNCTFEGTVLEYAGLGPVGFTGCKFKDVNWKFIGSAQHTLEFLSAIYHGFGEYGRNLVDSTFEMLKKPN